MSALRTVVAAHGQGSWNRMLRQLGRHGTVVLLAVLGLLFTTGVLPLVGGLGVIGFLAGQGLVEADAAPRNLSLLSLLLSGLTLLGGAFGGLSGSARQLPWESLQAFPVSPRTLFLAELVAGAGEAVTLIELLSVAALTAGVAVAAPAAAPFLLLLAATSTLVLLSTQLLVGSLAQRLSKQTRVLFLVLPLMAAMLSTLTPRLLEVTSQQTVAGAASGLLALGAALPTGQLLTASREALAGDWARVPVRLLPTVLLCAALVVAAYFAISREKPLSTLQGEGKRLPLWSFKTQLAGVARLQWTTLASSIPGRFGLVMPLLTVVLVRGPLAEVTGRGAWVVPAAFGYAALAGTNLLFNQFGLDRHGVKALLLLPIDDATLLRGKLLGFALWQGLQLAMLALLLALTGHPQPLPLLLGALLYGCFFLSLAMVGQFTSLWQPRPLTKGGMRGAQPPLVVVLLTLATLTISGSAFYGLLWALRTFAPGAEVPVFAALFALLLALSHWVLKANALLLGRSRERLVESLGAGA